MRPVSALRAAVALGVAIGCAAGATASFAEAWALERHFEHGLWRLALVRIGRATLLAGAIGAAGAGGAIAVVAAWRAATRRGASRLAPALVRQGRRFEVAALGLLLAAAAAWGAGAGAAARGAAGRPNVLLIVMDTVRADRLSTFGYARPTTPELDAFAREAIRFPRFYAPAPWTVPSHASLFTGTFPAHHGATQEHWSLDRRHATLAEVLRDAGYQTFAVSANPLVGRGSKLDQGFAAFREPWRESSKLSTERPAAHPVNRAFEELLRNADRDRPFFAFLNYMDAHRPYAPPIDVLARYARARPSALAASRVGSRVWTELYLDGPGAPADIALTSDLYDAELAVLSASIGALLEDLRRDGRYDSTLIAITSDHGEHLGEHGLWDHVFSLYEPVLHVPLLLRLPGGARAGTTDTRLGQLTDLLPTLLAACGVAAPSLPIQGTDLVDPARTQRPLVASYAYPHQALAIIGPKAATAHRDRLAPYLRSLRAVREGDHKVIEGSDGRVEIFDLAADPAETRNLAPADPALRETLLSRLGEAVGRGELPAVSTPRHVLVHPESSDRDRERDAALRALGYAQ
jgi:arylsulfatase A-like enzyme